MKFPKTGSNKVNLVISTIWVKFLASGSDKAKNVGNSYFHLSWSSFLKQGQIWLKKAAQHSYVKE